MLSCSKRTKRLMYYVLGQVSSTDLEGGKQIQNLLCLSYLGREGISLTRALPQKFVVQAAREKSTQYFFF